MGTLNLIKDIKRYNFDKIIIFNSSLRFNIIAKLARIPEIYQYPLFKKTKQHITNTPKKFLKERFNLEVNEDPELEINEMLISDSVKKFQIKKDHTNILLGIGGSGPTKRVPSNTFLNVIEKLSKVKKCKFFLATGKNNEEQIILNEIIDSKFNKLCTPLDDLSIKETLPIIKNCNLSVCNDSSFSHLSAALNIPTIVLMTDTPLVYGSYNSLMHPILPEGAKTVSHDSLGKDKINPSEIQKKLDEILLNIF